MLRRISNQLVIVFDERPEWNVREPACIWRADLNLYSSRRGIYSRDNPIARSTVSIYIAEELARLAFILACVARITGRYYAPSSPRRSANDRTHRKSRRFIRFFFSPLPSHRRGARYASDRIYIQFSYIRCSPLHERLPADVAVTEDDPSHRASFVREFPIALARREIFSFKEEERVQNAQRRDAA